MTAITTRFSQHVGFHGNLFLQYLYRYPSVLRQATAALVVDKDSLRIDRYGRSAILLLVFIVLLSQSNSPLARHSQFNRRGLHRAELIHPTLPFPRPSLTARGGASRAPAAPFLPAVRRFCESDCLLAGPSAERPVSGGRGGSTACGGGGSSSNNSGTALTSDVNR